MPVVISLSSSFPSQVCILKIWLCLATITNVLYSCKKCSCVRGIGRMTRCLMTDVPPLFVYVFPPAKRRPVRHRAVFRHRARPLLPARALVPRSGRRRAAWRTLTISLIPIPPPFLLSTWAFLLSMPYRCDGD